MDIPKLPYQLMDMLSDAVAVMDQNGVVVQVGDSFKDKCCDLLQSVRGESFEEFQHCSLKLDGVVGMNRVGCIWYFYKLSL